MCNFTKLKEMQFYLEIITCDPLVYAMDQPKFIVLNQMEESISTKRVNILIAINDICFVVFGSL